MDESDFDKMISFTLEIFSFNAIMLLQYCEVIFDMSGQKTLTERMGINQLENLLLSTGRVLPHFKEADKRVSWDGEMELYPSVNDLETKNMLGKIPVQIKSTVCDFEDKETITDSVNIQDLINYRNGGGCIYFVVYVCDHGTQVYYNILLPCDINQILEQAETQKTKTARFERFPTDSKTIIALLSSFIDNRSKLTSDENCIFMFDKLKEEQLKDIETFSFSLQGTNANPFSTIFDVPTYIYAKPKLGALIPFQRLNIDEFSVGDVPEEVWFDGKKYYDRVKVTKRKNMESIKIGKSCTFNSDGTFNYHSSGTLYEQIRDAEFFVKVCENPNKPFSIGSMMSGIVNPTTDTERLLENKKFLESLRSTKSALEYFGIAFDVELDFDNLTDGERQLLNILFVASKGKTIILNPPPASMLGNIKIANLTIGMLAIEKNGGFN